MKHFQPTQPSGEAIHKTGRSHLMSDTIPGTSVLRLDPGAAGIRISADEFISATGRIVRPSPDKTFAPLPFPPLPSPAQPPDWPPRVCIIPNRMKMEPRASKP